MPLENLSSRPMFCLLFFFSPIFVACASPPAAFPGDAEKSAGACPGVVLFVLSSAAEQTLQNGKKRPTGTFLSEFFEAYVAVVQEGYRVVIATQNGLAVAIDPEGLKETYWTSPEERAQAVRFAGSDAAFLNPIDLGEALLRVDEWDALVVPGGQGVMSDIVPSVEAHRLVLALARRHKPIGLICHAPALLKHLPKDDNPLLGKTVTSVSPFEEFYIETFVMKGKARERRVRRQLRRAGYAHLSALPKANHAVKDGNLVTSQNPYSGRAFAESFRQALRETRAATDCRSPQ